MTTRTIALRRDPDCPACGTRELRALIDYDAFCGGGGAAHGATADADAGIGEDDEMSVRELAERLRRGDALELIDVREPWEHEYARIPGARLVPLDRLAEAIPTLDPAREYVMQCHHGIRSRHAAGMLRAAGFRRVRNLAGGIAAWSAEIDAAVPSY
jgi:adenylyltransferase/sulfurtransferase